MRKVTNGALVLLVLGIPVIWLLATQRPSVAPQSLYEDRMAINGLILSDDALWDRVASLEAKMATLQALPTVTPQPTPTLVPTATPPSTATRSLPAGWIPFQTPTPETP